MPVRPDRTNATRQAGLRERRRAQGLRRLMVWCTESQADHIRAYLKGGTLPGTDTADTLQPRRDDVTSGIGNDRSDSITSSLDGTDTAPADDLLTQDEAAALLGVKQRMMQHWRKTGTGPAWQGDGPGQARYRRADVEAWRATWHKRGGGRRKQP